MKNVSIIVGGIIASMVLLTGVAAAASPKGDPFIKLWEAIQNLETQIANIPAGPQGPQGEQGPVGPQGPQGEPGTSGALSDVYGSTITPVPGDAASLAGKWSWAAPATGSYTAIARINYDLSTPVGAGAKIVCSLKTEGNVSPFDSAAESITLDNIGSGYVQTGKFGSFTLVGQLEFLNAGQGITVECTPPGSESNIATVLSVNLQLIPFNLYHGLTPITL